MTTTTDIMELVREYADEYAADQKYRSFDSDPDGALDALRTAVERLVAERDALRGALLSCARKAEALKRECGMDPESPQAIRNGQYQDISTTAHIALGTIRGPAALSAPAMTDLREAILNLPIGDDQITDWHDEGAFVAGFEAARHAAAELARAALSAPAGWKLVPIEPTREMLDAVRNGPEHETWRDGYHAMLAAAPSPQEQT